MKCPGWVKEEDPSSAEFCATQWSTRGSWEATQAGHKDSSHPLPVQLVALGHTVSGPRGSIQPLLLTAIDRCHLHETIHHEGGSVYAVLSSLENG